MNYTLRLFQPADERPVRRLCFETALYGRPIEALCDDETFITDAWLSYYWRFEPELFWVAVKDDRVVGYLTGCANTKRFARRYLWQIAPHLVRLFLERKLWQKLLFKVVLRNWRTLFAYGRRKEQALLRYFPAHCHVNVAAEARGQGLGFALVMRFLEELKARNIRGVHAVSGTQGGTNLFMKAGFASKMSIPTVRLTEESPEFVQVLVKEIWL
jgi:GNAT superfamily N-acetyltransferase